MDSPELTKPLQRELFPPVTQLTRPTSIKTALAVALAVVLATTCLVLWRPWPSAENLIWAEDGPVFLSQALSTPFGDLILEPYNGYLHIVPRILVEAVLLLPVTWWALALTTVTALLRASLGAIVWYALAAHIPSRFARAIIAVVLVTLPLGNYETLNSLANVHWFLMAAAVPALLWSPATWRGRMVQSALVAGAVLSDPVTCLLAPLVLLRLAAVRRWPDQIVSLVFVVASAIQAWIVLGSDRAPSKGIEAGLIAPTYLLHIVLASFGGKGGTEWAFYHLGWVAVAAAVLVSTVIFVLGLRVAGPHRGVAVTCLTASVMFFAVAMRFGIGLSEMVPSRTIDMSQGARYCVTAAVLFGAALVAAGAGGFRVSTGAPRRIMAISATALVLAYGASAVFTIGPADPRAIANTGPWRDAVEAACTSPGQAQATIAIAPATWVVTVPCDLIRTKNN